MTVSDGALWIRFLQYNMANIQNTLQKSSLYRRVVLRTLFFTALWEISTNSNMIPRVSFGRGLFASKVQIFGDGLVDPEKLELDLTAVVNLLALEGVRATPHMVVRPVVPDQEPRAPRLGAPLGQRRELHLAPPQIIIRRGPVPVPQSDVHERLRVRDVQLEALVPDLSHTQQLSLAFST